LKNMFISVSIKSPAEAGIHSMRGDNMKQMLKRLTALSLVLAMSLSLVCTNVWAADTEKTSEAQFSNAEAADELEVKTQSTNSGKCGKYVTWNLGSDGTLTISGTGKMYNYEEKQPAPWSNSEVKKVVIKSGVTNIGKRAFAECSLKSITIPNSVTNIGESAFAFSALTSVTIPNSVISISESAFYLSALAKVTIPNSVKSIDEDAFAGCEISNLTIPGSVMSMGEWAFSDCYKLTNVTIEEGVPEISDAAFANCEALKSVVIPKSVTKIGEYAFGLDDWVTNSSTVKIYFEGNAPKIGSEMFGEISSIKAYYPANDNTWTSSVRKSYGAKKITWTSWNFEKDILSPTQENLKNTSTGIQIKWDKIPNATKYEVYRSANGGNYSKVQTTTSINWTDKSVKSGTKYTYKIYAQNDNDKSKASNTKSICFISVPSLSNLTNSKGKKMVVKWKKVSGSSGYEIQYSSSSNFSNVKKVTVSKGSTVSKTISSLTKGKKYYVRIRSYKKSGDSKYYSAWSGSENVKISK
jgi:hypothetical protein